MFALLGFVLSKLNYRLKYEFVEREGGGREDAKSYTFAGPFIISRIE